MELWAELSAQQFVAGLAVAIGVYGYLPYFVGIAKGRTRPHIFSWFVWGLLTTIGWVAQMAEGAGPGAWVTGVTALACFFIAAAALRHGEKDITRSDWITFITALCAIPVWYLTGNPLWAVILITVIDALGFYPTFRKSWFKPQEEVVQTYFLSALKFLLSLYALETLNWTTALYPASLVFMNAAFVVMVLYRRHA